MTVARVRVARDAFADDYRETPYWWERSPPEAPTGAEPPAGADVVVVGSGYTGLHAAIECARAGHTAVVLDAGALGAGCSTRNGGQVSTSVKPSHAALARRHGAETATRVVRRGVESLAHVAGFVRDEDIDCDFATVGRYHAAHTERAWRRLAAAAARPVPTHDEAVRIVAREDQHAELGSDVYRGGAVYPHHASLDPGRYHAGCVAVARRAGVELVDRCAALRLTPSGAGVRVATERGAIEARRVVIATNGYTGALTPWLARRVVPIGSYVIATEAVPAALMDRLLPTMRILSDTRRLVYYYRPSPDRTRILFGGRVSLAETDHRVSGARLLAELRRLFPELAGVRVSHSWSGTVAYTFDTLAHVGRRDGVYHAMGYCGSGVGMAGYSGAEVGRAVVSDLAGNGVDAALGGPPTFPTRPLYRGRPWFLAPSVLVYRGLDRLGL